MTWNQSCKEREVPSAGCYEDVDDEGGDGHNYGPEDETSSLLQTGQGHGIQCDEVIGNHITLILISID